MVSRDRLVFLASSALFVLVMVVFTLYSMSKGEGEIEALKKAVTALRQDLVAKDLILAEVKKSLETQQQVQEPCCQLSA